jgi:hypothetical protein
MIGMSKGVKQRNTRIDIRCGELQLGANVLCTAVDSNFWCYRISTVVIASTLSSLADDSIYRGRLFWVALHSGLDHSSAGFSLEGSRSTVLRWFRSDAQYCSFDVLSILGGTTFQRGVHVLSSEVGLHSRRQSDRLIVSRVDRSTVTFVLYSRRQCTAASTRVGHLPK